MATKALWVAAAGYVAAIAGCQYVAMRVAEPAHNIYLTGPLTF